MDVNMNYDYYVQPQQVDYPSPQSNYSTPSPRPIHPRAQYPHNNNAPSEWQMHFANHSSSRNVPSSSAYNHHQNKPQSVTAHYQNPPPPSIHHQQQQRQPPPQRTKNASTSEWHLQIRRIKTIMETSEKELRQLDIEISAARAPDDLFQLLKRHAMQGQHVEICRRAVLSAYKEARAHGVHVDL